MLCQKWGISCLPTWNNNLNVCDYMGCSETNVLSNKCITKQTLMNWNNTVSNAFAVDIHSKVLSSCFSKHYHERKDCKQSILLQRAVHYHMQSHRLFIHISTIPQCCPVDFSFLYYYFRSIVLVYNVIAIFVEAACSDYSVMLLIN